jgi:ornithine cyclodeaminase/alanine dehydrogenase-like protein (mu-crystallin family)
MAYDIDRAALDRYVTEMTSRFGLEVIPVGTPRQAVSGCDIVVTAGPIMKIPHATIRGGWLEAGAFASLVDYDSYWHPEALAEVDKFCTDDIPQLEYYRTVGYFQNIPPVYADLGKIVTGRKPGRQTAEERTMTCNLGLALDDLATAPLVYELAIENRIGTWLQL